MPVIASTGAWSSFASYKPLSRWMAPGPEVATQTPNRPVALAYPVAMNAAASSWCTRMNRSLSRRRRNPSIRPLMPSPGRPKTVSTPHATMRRARLSPTVWPIASPFGRAGGGTVVAARRARPAACQMCPHPQLSRSVESMRVPLVRMAVSDARGGVDGAIGSGRDRLAAAARPPPPAARAGRSRGPLAGDSSVMMVRLGERRAYPSVMIATEPARRPDRAIRQDTDHERASASES
jgi:hypothetical protein